MSEKQLPSLEFSPTLAVKTGDFVFPNYDQAKRNILLIRDYLKDVEVTEDGLKEAKKLVASIRKEVNSLNDTRIQAKKEYLKPYEIVASQIKELSDIATEAENFIRVQTRELEEKERDEKESYLSDIFEKRKAHYDYQEFFEFEDFLKPQYLNKSFSINKAEQEMVDWLEQRKFDLQVLETSVTDIREAREYIRTYFFECGLNLNQTLLEIKNREKQSIEVKKHFEKKDPQNPVETEPTVLIEIPVSSQSKVLAMLNTMEVKYQVIK